ncbi:unnamed protein product [Coffea canephora]|uniref:Neprosin PEP catalytic domain-containing protein n=1 Tax=Coffea canephora TaxID=49390 RepID=A0A068UQ50_COFCA|nr:unnamed protein product [Coffea canephora]
MFKSGVYLLLFLQLLSYMCLSVSDYICLELYPSTCTNYAIAYVQGDKYHGAKATINVWQPYVQNRIEFSLSQIWVVGGGGSNTNTIEAGWTVDPSVFGDNKPRLFTYWTRDHYGSTGCYNMFCPGFVQTSTKIALGTNISPVSTYHGPQFDISLYIVKDEQFAVWWLQLGNDVVGYWPTSLFTNLADSASTIQWGGEVINLKPNRQHSTTQMGSGHFPEEGFKGASYFKNLQVVDDLQMGNLQVLLESFSSGFWASRP